MKDSTRGPAPVVSAAVFRHLRLHLFGAVAAFAAPVGEAIPVWTVLVAGLAAMAAMVGWLWRSHPRLERRIRSAGNPEDRDQG